MKIYPLSINTYTQRYNIQKRAAVKPVPYDTVSFCALKKSELSPIDLYCAETLKAPLEKFDNKQDFDSWADDEFYEKSDINKYYSKYENDNIDRIYRLDVWKEHLKKYVCRKNPALALLVLESITAPLTNENKEQPPIFNTKVFNETAKHITERLSDDPDFQFCFNKLYQNTLRHYVISGDSTVGKYDTCWVKIPTSDPQKEEFKQNVKKLKILSHRSWCTKSTHAKTYLSMGDFYIYYDNGQPKACIRMEKDNVAEIVCENNLEFSDKYINEAINFINKENLSADEFENVLLGGKYNKYKNGGS